MVIEMNLPYIKFTILLMYYNIYFMTQPVAEKPTRPTTAAPYADEGSSAADQAERR